MSVQVTSEDWHCPTCADRHLARHVAVSHRFDNIDSFRNRELEDELLEKAISLKAGLKVDNAMPVGFWLEIVCLIFD